MSAKLIYEEVVLNLKNTKSSIRCQDLADQLSTVGFEIRAARGGHKLYFHDGILSFMSASYNCGHGRNPEIKPVYVRKAIKILELYESEIIEFLKGENK